MPTKFRQEQSRQQVMVQMPAEKLKPGGFQIHFFLRGLKLEFILLAI
jgi:hypothetical protein